MSIDKFEGKATHYEKGRPSYPAEVIAYLKALVHEDAVIADIGAGTGKLTELMAQVGFEVFAVEPNGDMYAQLQKTLTNYPKASTILGTSEMTTLEVKSIDMITVAQALHWFDLEKFRAECQRILKPNGWVVALYNNGVGQNGEVAEKASHRLEATHQFFTMPTVKEFEHPITYTRSTWQSYMLSHSYSPVPSDENYEAFVYEINQIFDNESKDGIMHRKLITSVYAQQLD